MLVEMAYPVYPMGLIPERVNRCLVAQYQQENIWQSLDMEYPASLILDSTQSEYEMMVMGLNSRSIEFAKVCKLNLENSRWNE